ncbi:MAG: hypothetical protein R3F07_08995 [Opitutaceae bacterium]
MKHPIPQWLLLAILKASIIAIVPGTTVTEAQTTPPDAVRSIDANRMDRAFQAALSSDLATAEQILLEDLPADRPTPSDVIVIADRFSRLAFQLQNTDHDEAARHFGAMALEACLSSLSAGTEQLPNAATAQLLKRTGQLLKQTNGDLPEAARLFRLAYDLDPQGQIESLYLAQALEERDRVIAERRAEESRAKEVQP